MRLEQRQIQKQENVITVFSRHELTEEQQALLCGALTEIGCSGEVPYNIEYDDTEFETYMDFRTAVTQEAFGWTEYFGDGQKKDIVIIAPILWILRLTADCYPLRFGLFHKENNRGDLPNEWSFHIVYCGGNDAVYNEMSTTVRSF